MTDRVRRHHESNDRTVTFTANEVGLLKGLVRMRLRKTLKGRQSSIRRFGDTYDATQHDEKEALLRGLYSALGGDPDNIQGIDRE